MAFGSDRSPGCGCCAGGGRLVCVTVFLCGVESRTGNTVSCSAGGTVSTYPYCFTLPPGTYTFTVTSTYGTGTTTTSSAVANVVVVDPYGCCGTCPIVSTPPSFSFILSGGFNLAGTMTFGAASDPNGNPYSGLSWHSALIFDAGTGFYYQAFGICECGIVVYTWRESTITPGVFIALAPDQTDCGGGGSPLSFSTTCNPYSYTFNNGSPGFGIITSGVITQ